MHCSAVVLLMQSSREEQRPGLGEIAFKELDGAWKIIQNQLLHIITVKKSMTISARDRVLHECESLPTLEWVLILGQTARVY